MAIKKSVAVIGAGLAGATVAYRLQQAGFDVTVFEQGHKVGGRMASGRLLEATVDLGAPVLAKGQESPELIELAQSLKVVEPWLAHVADFLVSDVRPRSFYVVREHSRLLPRQLLSHIERRNDTPVTVAWPDRDGVLLRDSGGNALGYYDIAVIATTAPQAVSLLDAVPRFRQLALAASYRPLWTLQIAFAERPAALAEIDWLRGRHPVLKEVIRNSSKPGRSGEVWCIEANFDWSERHINTLPGEVRDQLLEALMDLCGGRLPRIDACQSKLWRRAFCESKTDRLMIWDFKHGLGACGDWLGGKGIEGAFVSGMALADAIVHESRISSISSEEAKLTPGIGQKEFFNELEAGD